jgi:hypothetical protein
MGQGEQSSRGTKEEQAYAVHQAKHRVLLTLMLDPSPGLSEK